MVRDYQQPQASLRRVGSDLVVAVGKPEEVIPQLLAASGGGGQQQAVAAAPGEELRPDVCSISLCPYEPNTLTSITRLVWSANARGRGISASSKALHTCTWRVGACAEACAQIGGDGCSACFAR